MTTTDHRKAAEERIKEFIAIVRDQPAGAATEKLLDESEALARAISAFHMEGIRFRSYNVDRLLQLGQPPMPPLAADIFRDMRKSLEAAGFHTRSHQSPA